MLRKTIITWQSLYSLPIAAITYWSQTQSFKTIQTYYLSVLKPKVRCESHWVKIKVWYDCIPFWRLQENMCLLAHSEVDRIQFQKISISCCLSSEGCPKLLEAFLYPCILPLLRTSNGAVSPSYAVLPLTSSFVLFFHFLGLISLNLAYPGQSVNLNVLNLNHIYKVPLSCQVTQSQGLRLRLPTSLGDQYSGYHSDHTTVQFS